MKGFSGFGNESPVKKFDPNASDFHHAKQFDFSKSGRITNVRRPGAPRVSTKPTSYGSRATINARNFAKANKVGDLYTAAGRAKPRAKFKTAKGKIGRKVAGKLGSKLLGPIGAALAVKDAIGTYKDIKKGMKPGKAARKNFLGF